MVDNCDGTHTFTNANGDILTIDSVVYIINNFVESCHDVIAPVGANTTEVTFDGPIPAMRSNVDGSFNFANANDHTLLIEFAGRVIYTFEHFVTRFLVTVDGTTYTSVEEYFET